MTDNSPLPPFPAHSPRGASVSHWGAGDFDDDYARWRAEYERDMRSRRRRGPRRPLIIPVLVGVALLFCGAFFTAPFFAFRAVRSAAQFGDVEALNQTVDFDAVRQSLRVQLRPASPEAEAPASLLRDPLAALRRAWEPLSPQEDVNAYLSAESLAAMASGRNPDDFAHDVVARAGGPFPRLRYWGMERARLGVPDSLRSDQETIFTFERRGLFRWTLVGVKLPEFSAFPSA